jgi:hypothetical protein
MVAAMLPTVLMLSCCCVHQARLAVGGHGQRTEGLQGQQRDRPDHPE